MVNALLHSLNDFTQINYFHMVFIYFSVLLNGAKNSHPMLILKRSPAPEIPHHDFTACAKEMFLHTKDLGVTS